MLRLNPNPPIINKYKRTPRPDLGVATYQNFMPYRREQFVNGEIYHIIIRRIDNNLLFKDIDDHYRGIFSIYEFNNANPVNIGKRRRDIQVAKKIFREKFVLGREKSGRGRASPGSSSVSDLRERLVDVFLFLFDAQSYSFAITAT